MIEHIEQGTLAPNIRACIALTSWKKRINTVGLTIYNLFETCGPDYHIVLTLAEEEFPKKEQELPKDLLLMNRAGMFEILWVKKNYKPFKKWIFSAARYSNVPIISADDDCVYTCNYAEELYRKWKSNPSLNGIRYEYGRLMQMQGPTSLYYLPKNVVYAIIALIDDTIIRTGEDDPIMYKFMKIYKCKFGFVHEHIKKPYIFHDTIAPLHSDETFKKLPGFRDAFT